MPAHAVGVQVAPGVLHGHAIFQAPREGQLRRLAEANGGVALRLDEWGGVDYAQWLDSVAVRDASGAWIEGERRPGGAWMVPSVFVADRLVVRWQVRSAKRDFAGEGREGIFQPTLLEDHAFVWGHGWVLRPDGVANIPVRVSVAPGPWAEPPRVLGAESGVVARFQALPRMLLLAGVWDSTATAAAGRTLRFFIRPGTRAFTNEQLVAGVAAVARSQAGAMAGVLPVTPTFVVEDGTPASSGGSVEGPLVALHPDPSLPLEAKGAPTLRLVAHELFHFWNGTHARPDTTVGEGWYKWFQEGITEYVAVRTLLRLGVMDAAGFIDEVNDAATRHAANPVAARATSAVLAERFWSDESYRTLPYVRGFLLGFLVDLRIRAATDGAAGIDAWLRRAIRPDLERGPMYDDADLLRALEAVTGRDEGAWYRAYATGTEPLPMAEACAAHGMSCERRPLEVWDLQTTAMRRVDVPRLLDTPATRAVVEALRR